MPRSNRPSKKSSTNTNTHKRNPSNPAIVYTKRTSVLDSDGWTHVVDTPRSQTRRARAATLTKAANGELHAGDFEIDGVAYVSRTREEMEKEVKFWERNWETEAEGQRVRLVKILEGGDGVVKETVPKVQNESEEDKVLEGENEKRVLEGEKMENVEVGQTASTDAQEITENIPEIGEAKPIVAQIPSPESIKDDAQDTAAEKQESKEEEPTLVVDSPQVAEAEAATSELSPAPATNEAPAVETMTSESSLTPPTNTTAAAPPSSPRQKVDNIVVLGLGSLQSARREGRRATLAQLAALKTIVETFSAQTSTENQQPLKVILQEPHFTPLDIEYLQSLPNYEIVNDPIAFSKITEGSLVYGIHCYSQVYKAVSEGPRPAVLIGTDIDNFARFNMSEEAEATQKQLEKMIEGCEILDFPQVRHDFSDTKIYWRTAAEAVPEPTST